MSTVESADYVCTMSWICQYTYLGRGWAESLLWPSISKQLQWCNERVNVVYRD